MPEGEERFDCDHEGMFPTHIQRTMTFLLHLLLLQLRFQELSWGRTRSRIMEQMDCRFQVSAVVIVKG